jgi:hypothetical protein
MNHLLRQVVNDPKRLFVSSIPIYLWRSHAFRRAQLLDVSPLTYVCGSVNRGRSDLR